MTKPEQMRILLEYINQHQELDYFLSKIEQERSDIFTKYPQLSKDTIRKRALEQSRLSRIREKSFQASSNPAATHNTNSSLESSLLILIKRLELDYFKIQAWFWSSIKQCPIQESQIIKLTVDESTKDKCYQEFSQKITEFIEKSNSLMREIGSEDLRIELFLSTDLLKKDNYNFDWIKIKKARFFVKICEKYPVVFRLAERLELDYQDSIGDWKRRWNQIQSSNCPFINYGQNIHSHSIGIILDKISNIETFFSLIYLKAIPIALWSRCELNTISPCREINRIINSPNVIQDFRQLPVEIKNERETAQPGIEHIGHYICLLWDDPERMPPNEALSKYSLSSI